MAPSPLTSAYLLPYWDRGLQCVNGTLDSLQRLSAVLGGDGNDYTCLTHGDNPGGGASE